MQIKYLLFDPTDWLDAEAPPTLRWRHLLEWLVELSDDGSLQWRSGGSLTQPLSSPPCGIKGCYLWHINVWRYAECCCQPGKFTCAFVSRVLVGLRFISMNDWIIGHKVEQNFQRPPHHLPPQKSGWYPVAQSPNPPSNTWGQSSARVFFITQDLTTKQSF